MTTETKKVKGGPQADINDFWAKFATKKPRKVTSIFPRFLYASILPEHPDPRGIASARNAAESYEAAAKECRDKVEKIVRECYRTNEKFTDSDFDIESDFDHFPRNCLDGLEYENEEAAKNDEAQAAAGSSRSGDVAGVKGPGGDPARRQHRVVVGKQTKNGVEAGEFYSPCAIHRVEWIFQKPQFTIDGYSSSDIQQGGNGDCWWLAAVATIAHRKDLMERVCVARNEECGVYGFVFHRDGEWVSTVVDDNLYLKTADFRDAWLDIYDPAGEKARKHRLQNQTGSEALYFGHCADPNETWLPLMEKAYAKAHGDYNAIAGGWSGEAVEDMTGGVTTTISTKRVLRKEKLWKELAYGDGDFVFALSALGWAASSGGVVLGHAYSILRATEEVDEDGGKVRLVQIRNPWGQRSEWDGLGEWNGSWSDGSKEWTPYWMKKLGHKFGDDGVFWMSFEDMLETFKYLHRTRLFDEKWTVIQQWTSCEVSWITGYLRNKFIIDVKKKGTFIIILAQLDERYFTGLTGQYDFSLHFLLRKEGSSATDYICRVRPAHEWESRSVSCEIELEPGRYEVLPKITATREKEAPTLEKLVKHFAEKNPQKLRQVGMQYDLAHSKGGIPDEDLNFETKKAKLKRKEAERKKKEKAATVKVAVEIDIPSADTAKKDEKQDKKDENEDKKDDKKDTSSDKDKKESTDKDEKAVTLEGEDDKFEDATENLEKADADKAKETEKAASGTETSLVIRVNDTIVETDGTGDEKKDKDSKEESEPKQDVKKDDKPEKKDDEAKNESEDESSDSEEEEPDRWNAVCVTSLRVYSQDPDLTISLVKPEDMEETSTLVQGQEPAGATM